MNSAASFKECKNKVKEIWREKDSNERSIYDITVKNNCICGDNNKSTKWVGCDICDRWNHTKCVDIGNANSQEMPFFHCKGCINTVFRPFVNYVAYLCTMRDDNMTHTYVAGTFKQFHEKGVSMQKEIGEQSNPFLPYSHLPLGVRETVKGIDNTFKNCWLNATLQITCGTSMYTLLPQSIDQDASPLTHHVTDVVVADTIKVINFGKATMMTNPVIYSIAPGTTTHQMYNTRHRHLAYELQNVPGSKQSIATDTYSLGFMLKHAAATLRFSPLIQLGRMMKHTDPASRATIQSGSDKIQMSHSRPRIKLE